MNGAVAVVAAVAGISLIVAWIYNRLVRLRNLSRSSWSDVDVLLKKRHDLVDNLVETVKGYSGFEKSVLQGVTEARARAIRAEGPGERGKEESGLKDRLSSLIAVAESYPDLKASQVYLELQKRLAGLENDIEYARRYYNAVVRDYNTAAETFPANLVSRPLGFEPAEFFQLDSPEERERTDVKLAALLLPLLLPILAAVPARAGDFTIRSFHAAFEVRRDASLRIVETIETRFHRMRHGIYRDIPFRYVDELGKTTLSPVRIDSVTDADGAARKYRVERSGGMVRVRIGDPKRYVSGRQVYVISYTVENAVLFFPDHDELYWNVTGNGWAVPIDAASAAVSVLAGERTLNVRTACYTGPRGSRERACRATAARNGAVFSSTRPFGPGEGLTIAAGWEKGVVTPPSALRTSLYRLDIGRNWPLGIPLAVFGYMFVLWLRKGKDPSADKPLTVAYGPPEEKGRPLLPAEVGALIDEKLDPRDITASVVDLAVKGYLKIEEVKTPGLLFDKTDYSLERTKEPGGELPAFERMLLERIFQGRGARVNVSELKLSFYKYIDELKAAAFRELVEMKCFATAPAKVQGRYVGIGILVLVVGTGLAVAASAILGRQPGLLPLASILSGVAVLGFAPFMPVKTTKGADVLGRIKGFEEFLARAEKDRLERMNDKNLFEKFLPYAIALGVSDRWAESFEGIYQEPPGWYASTSGIGSFRTTAFHHSLGTALSGMSNAMYAAPRSSGGGSSGGGSSGGGGGGGGGGSW